MSKNCTKEGVALAAWLFYVDGPIISLIWGIVIGAVDASTNQYEIQKQQQCSTLTF